MAFRKGAGNTVGAYKHLPRIQTLGRIYSTQVWHGGMSAKSAPRNENTVQYACLVSRGLANATGALYGAEEPANANDDENDNHADDSKVTETVDVHLAECVP